MAGTKTNSNSMTALLIVALNNKKSAFRNEFLKQLAMDDDDFKFEDGTHCSIEYSEINGKKVDVVGRIKGRTSFLMEVKVGINECLQPSQAKNGEYETVFSNHRDEIRKLVYLIPDNYAHESELPECSKIIYWSNVYQIAKEFDNSGLEACIEQFVEFSVPQGSNLLSKGEFYMLINKNAFCDSLNLIEKMISMGTKFCEQKDLIFCGNQKNIYGVGVYFDVKNSSTGNLYVGLNPSIENSDFFFSLAVHKNLQINMNAQDLKYIFEGDYTYISFDKDENYQTFCISENEEEQQESFNNMVYNVLRKLKLVK